MHIHAFVIWGVIKLPNVVILRVLIYVHALVSIKLIQEMKVKGIKVNLIMMTRKIIDKDEFMN